MVRQDRHPKHTRLSTLKEEKKQGYKRVTLYILQFENIAYPKGQMQVQAKISQQHQLNTYRTCPKLSNTAKS